VFCCLILAVTGVDYWSNHRQMPPSLGPADCVSVAPPDELPNARFARKGGRTTRYVKVWRQGTALVVDNVAQERDLPMSS
jgi:hypothetical protein